VEVTGVTTAEVTITVEVTAAEIKAVKTTGVAEAEVTAEAKAAATTVAAVKEVMVVVVAVAMAGADTIMVAIMVSMEDSRVMATTSEAVEAAAGVSEPVVKAAAEAMRPRRG